MSQQDCSTIVATGVAGQQSIYRFAPGTEHKRTAIALQDGRFLEVKPTKQMFANGDAWSTSFMGEGALLADGISSGHITVEEKGDYQKQVVEEQPQTISQQIAKQFSMLRELNMKSRTIQIEIQTTISQLTRLHGMSARYDYERMNVEETIKTLLDKQNRD